MIINEKLINLNIEANSKEDVINHLTELAVKEDRLYDAEVYKKAVLDRELEYSTAMGFGIAIPHGKTAAVKEPFLCFGKVNAIDWKALDGAPVNLVFMIGVPEEAGNTHLKILAAISRKLMKQEFRDGLSKANSPAELMQFLLESELGI